MADAKKIAGGLGKVSKALLADGEEAVTAAQRAEAGRKAAELIKSQTPVKASEALGQLMEKRMKRVTTTQADRTRVGGGNIGGAPFSALSEADPNYAGKVWGVMDEGTAARLKNLTDPETVWTTMLGSANQLKTNPVVFDKLKRQFIESMKQGNLSPELEAKINHNLALTFGEGAQIRDPKIWRQADTFDKRAALADLMMGQGIPPKKGGVALGGEKSGKGVIFKPTDTLKRETEPYLLHSEHGGDVPTFAAGPRLFTLEKESVYRPDLHPGFPTLLTGKDLEVNMIPTPTEIFLPDWHREFKKKKPERFQGPWSPEIVDRRKSGSYQLKGAEGPGYYDLALGLEGEGLPSQALNDEYIRHLLREGFKDGGSVDIDAADARLSAAIEKRMAKGGAVDIEAADARLADAIAQRMAGGGKVAKGAAKVFKKLFSDDVLPTAQRDANLQKFLAPSAEKRRMYHGSKEPNIKEFKTRKEMTDESMMTGHYADERDAVFLSPEPQFTKHFSQEGYTDTHQAPTTYPVHVQIEKPFDFDNPEHLGKVKETYLDMYHNPDSDLYDPYMLPSERSMAIHTFNKRVDNLPNDENNWARIENQDFQDVLKDLGFDSFYTRERGTKNLGVYEPNRIKSAIGNRGTYDLGDSDINKADGGLLHMADAGKVVGGMGKVFRKLLADDVVNGMRVRKDIPNTSSIGASLTDYSTHGLQEVPMSAFETVGKPRYRSVQEEKRTKELARQIQENKELNPLIVVKDAEGHYILEGGHRFDALRELDIDSFPALVVHDLESLGTVAKADGGKVVKGAGKVFKKLFEDAPVESQAAKQMRLDMMPTARIGLPAPGIIIPGKINNVREAVRNMKGNYGARRVERAADEIPNLERMYKEDALAEAFTGDNARALMTMNPADFENYAARLHTRNVTEPKSFADKTRMSTEDYLKYLRTLPEGFDEVPYLKVHKEEAGLPLMPHIYGHEGRHRNRALAGAGEQSNLVQFFPNYELHELPRRTQEEYIEALKEELGMTGNKVKPERYFDNLKQENIKRPPIDLPDIYAGGGLAMAGGGKLVKSGAKVLKKLFADDVLPVAERDANLQNFLAKSQVKEPVFHAAKTDVKQFSPKHRTELSSMGHHFGTAEQANFRTGQYDFGSQTPNVGKYHLNIQNPLEVSHMASYAPDHLAEQLMDMNLLKPEIYDALSAKHNYDPVAVGDELIKVLQKNGYDGLKYANEMEGEGFSFVPLKPTQIKSAIGNQGTYDINVPDLNKAEGGLLHMADAGRVVKGGAKFLNKLLSDAPQQEALRVYHGSPHRMAPVPDNPLGKFDSSKIGTGEGGAAYGIGHYLAQAKDVAKTYRPRSPQHEEKLIKEYNRAQAKRNYPKMEVLEDAMLHKSPDEILSKYSNIDDGYTPEHAKAANEYLKWLEKNKPEVGGLYHVDLPNEHISKMLDWDKPMKSHPSDIKKMLDDWQWSQIEAEAAKRNMSPYDFEKEVSMTSRLPPNTGGGISGEQYYSALAEYLGGRDKASKALQEMGIPGIKYYDEASRPAGGWEVGKSGKDTWMLKNHQLSSNQWKEFPTEEEAIAAYNAMPDVGTRNFVVFPGNEDMAKIVDREKKGGAIHKAEGGGAFKKIQFMDKGGITTSGGTFSPEELGVNPSDIGMSDKRWNKIKSNASELYGEGKEQLEKEYRQLGYKGGKKDFAIRVGSQLLGGGSDLVNLGLMGLDFVQSAIPAISKPESVLDTAGTGDRIPKFKLASDEPWLGSEHFIRKFKEAELLGNKEFPLTELAAGFVAPAAAANALRKSKQAYKGAKALMDTPKKRRGGLTAMAR